jgi:hypothetical protein
MENDRLAAHSGLGRIEPPLVIGVCDQPRDDARPTGQGNQAYTGAKSFSGCAEGPFSPQ